MAALLMTAGAFAQKSGIPVIKEIVDIERDGMTAISVFNMPAEGVNHYYLTVGTLGFGDEVVQILFDPVFQLFLPLGDTLEEAIASLQEMQGLFKQPKDSSLERSGCLAFGFPNDQLETVTVTHRKPLLTRQLEFSLQREGYIRATYVDKADMGSLITSVRFYRKIHPRE